MPIFKPGGTIPIVLDIDTNEETPLTFVCVALSVNQANELESRLDAVLSEPLTSQERNEQLCAMVSPLVTDWKNGPCAYSWAALLDNIGPSDLWALAYSIRRQLAYREKKV